MLAVEAFRAAADPKAYPEQLQYVGVWQARRIVWNKGVFGPAKPGELDGFASLDVGTFDPVLGSSAGEVAARSRSMHKSQGFGAAPQRGPLLEYFRGLAGEPMKADFLEGVDLTWGRVPGAEKLRAALAKARAQHDVPRPAATVPALLEAAAALDALPEAPWKAQKQKDLSEALAGCLGLFVDATVAEFTAVPGGQVKVTLTALGRSPASVVWWAAQLLGTEVAVGKPLVNNVPQSVERAVTLPADMPLSTPYWLLDPPSAGRWSVRDPQWVGLPEQVTLPVDFTFTVGGRELVLTRAVGFVWTDPVMGERRRPLEVLPPVTVDLRQPVLMFPDGKPRELKVSVRASRGAAVGVVKPEMPAGFTMEPAQAPFSLAAADAEQELRFTVKPPAKLASDAASQSGVARLVATLDGSPAPLTRGLTRVEYPHIPVQTTLPVAEVKLVRFALKTGPTRVGYIPGAGDDVPQALRQVGYEVTVLSDEALAASPLEPFGAIVVGIRAFNTNPKLARVHQRLMDYVAAGGTLLVQYNTQNRLSKLVGPLGPFAFNVSQDRVTDETAPATLLAPKDVTMTAPNALGEADFADWVQERGLYFADTWDAQYTPLLSMHDPGEPERKGGLLLARVGKGRFIYTGLAFFRQLPAGVPGAYRLFANLLAHDR
jgi:hypothetical protein